MLRPDLFIALQVSLIQVDLGVVRQKLSLGLLQLSLKWPRIDHKKEVAFLDLLPLYEMDFRDSAADLRLDIDRYSGETTRPNSWSCTGTSAARTFVTRTFLGAAGP
jgi:hypothetical protein